MMAAPCSYVGNNRLAEVQVRPVVGGDFQVGRLNHFGDAERHPRLALGLRRVLREPIGRGWAGHRFGIEPIENGLGRLLVV